MRITLGRSDLGHPQTRLTSAIKRAYGTPVLTGYICWPLAEAAPLGLLPEESIRRFGLGLTHAERRLRRALVDVCYRDR